MNRQRDKAKLKFRHTKMPEDWINCKQFKNTPKLLLRGSIFFNYEEILHKCQKIDTMELKDAEKLTITLLIVFQETIITRNDQVL